MSCKLLRHWTFLSCLFSMAIVEAASFTILGEFPVGSREGRSAAVSHDGLVVVGESVGQAFRWTLADGMVSLGNLPDGTVFSGVSDVSAHGSVVVGDAGLAAVRWTSMDGAVDIGELTGGPRTTAARAVSANGEIVVGYSHTHFAQEAFLWTPGNGMFGLGFLPTGDRPHGSYARGVSADGSVVVGQSTYGASGITAFRWTASEGMVELSGVPGSLSLISAYGVSANGSVIVGHARDSSGNSRAFRWTAIDGAVPLGELSGGAYLVRADGVSADGLVAVGGVRSVGAGVWMPQEGARGIDDILLEQGIDIGEWILTWAPDISANGSVVVGTAWQESIGRRPFIATIATTIAIDIKPTKKLTNEINPSGKGLIPVVIWSNDGFDALQVNTASLRFGPAQALISHSNGHITDVDKDGDVDLLVHFRLPKSGITCSDDVLYLRGVTHSGERFVGEDSINTVNCQ